MGRPGRIENEGREELSRTLRGARLRLKWSAETLAEKAALALAEAAADEKFPATPAERVLWADLDISRHHIAAFEGYPAQPMGSMRRRARLLGICLALGVDRAYINRLAGGV